MMEILLVIGAVIEISVFWVIFTCNKPMKVSSEYAILKERWEELQKKVVLGLATEDDLKEREYIHTMLGQLYERARVGYLFKAKYPLEPSLSPTSIMMDEILRLTRNASSDEFKGKYVRCMIEFDNVIGKIQNIMDEEADALNKELKIMENSNNSIQNNIDAKGCATIINNVSVK